MITRGRAPLRASACGRTAWQQIKSIPPWLHENIKDNAVLIDCSPEVMRGSVDLEEDFIQMPFIPGPSTTSPQTRSILFAKLLAPAPHRLIAEPYSPSRHHFFDIAEAHTEPEIKPNAVRNDRSRESMATVRTVRHSSSMPSTRRERIST